MGQIRMEGSIGTGCPTVSVITPAYNSAQYVGEAIESVLGQTIGEWEMIVVDDCSRDSTREIVADYSSRDRRIRSIPLKERRGPAGARNVGLDAARGRYVAFLDSDDIWLNHKLERQLEFMRRKKSAFSYTLFRRMAEDGSRLGKVCELPEKFDYHGLLMNTGIGCLTVMIDREKTGMITMPEIKHEDYALWLSLLKRGVVAHGLQEDLARYRVVEGSVSRGAVRSMKWVWKIYMHEKLSPFYASWCLVNYGIRAYQKRLNWSGTAGGLGRRDPK